MRFSDLSNPKAAAELIKEFRMRFSAGVCLSPKRDCDGDIIAAHTLSVSGMLRPISRNSLVYALKEDLFKAEDGWPGKIVLRGLRETSVFNGFCAKHDKRLFAPIEDEEFRCSREQLFLHAYRAIAKEAYLKRKQAEGYFSLEKVKEMHGMDHELVYSEEMLCYLTESLRGAEEIERLKSRLDAMLVSQDYGRMVTTIIPFSSRPAVVTSFVYVPDFDFEGVQLQDFESFDCDVSHLIVTILPAPNGGFMLMTHEDTVNAAPRNLIASLLRQADITSSVVWFVACQTENFALSPEWYDALSESDRKKFVAAFVATADPFNCALRHLKSRDLTVPSWGPGRPFAI